MLGRRGFLKGAGATAVAAPVVAPMMAEAATQVGPRLGGFGGGQLGPVIPPGMPTMNEAAYNLYRKECERQRHLRTVHWIDHDIRALKSTADWHKFSVQMIRNREQETFLEKLKREAFGE